MTRDKQSSIWLGLGLIALGFTFILAQWIGWDKIWPVFPIFGGLAFLAMWAGGGFRDSGLVLVGTAAILVGLFFFGFTLGYWEWGEMSRLWPVFVLIGGVSFLTAFLASKGRDLGLLGLGIAALVAGMVGMAVTAGLVTTDIVKWWPLLLIFLGLVGLVGVLLSGSRRA